MPDIIFYNNVNEFHKRQCFDISWWNVYNVKICYTVVQYITYIVYDFSFLYIYIVSSVWLI